MTCRGIRGAITVDANTEDGILAATTDLLRAIMAKNAIVESDIVSIFFSVTPDLNATFPAKAARQLNLVHTPMICFHEMDVPHGLRRCIRILMHINSDQPITGIHHVYLKEAASLRPDIRPS
jgi:chorismate mutase